MEIFYETVRKIENEFDLPGVVIIELGCCNLTDSLYSSLRTQKTNKKSD